VSGGYDDGIENLQNFCDLLEKTVAQVQEKNGVLDSQADTLDDLEGRAEDVIGQFSSAIEEGQGEIDAAHGEATAAVEGLAQAAQEAAGSDLGSIESQLDSAESTFDQKKNDAQSDLDDDFGRLTSEGFGGFAATVDELEDRAGALQQENQADAQALSGGLDTLETEATQDGTETGEAIGQGITGVQSDGGEFMRDALLATEGWSTELADLKQGCSEAGTDLSDLYAAWGTESEAEGDALIKEMTEAGQEATDFVSTDGAMQLETSLDGVLGEPLPGLGSGLSEAETLVEAGEALGHELQDLVPQLEICLNVVENINRLLEEMGT
jgi:uncharacterized phage infection (PIP) family protein YhgE